ncbi:hypothetical protein [Mucilaginibacter gossypii]|uniref:hypothetical protein n=1 Tax=Mucilaginibacter gossypii TaxID=551996 RepID=UPI000B1F747A|nr:hypothetical protein [Mucilaginibacter gossypii]
MTTLAGSGDRAFADGAPATASFSEPIGLAADVQGILYGGDCFNNRIRKISRKGEVTTIAGSGLFASNNGNGISASSFHFPENKRVNLT